MERGNDARVAGVCVARGIYARVAGICVARGMNKARRARRLIAPSNAGGKNDPNPYKHR